MSESTDAEVDAFLRDAWKGHDPDESWPEDTPEQRAERAETMVAMWPLQLEAMADLHDWEDEPVAAPSSEPS